MDDDHRFCPRRRQNRVRRAGRRPPGVLRGGAVRARRRRARVRAEAGGRFKARSAVAGRRRARHGDGGGAAHRRRRRRPRRGAFGAGGNAGGRLRFYRLGSQAGARAVPPPDGRRVRRPYGAAGDGRGDGAGERRLPLRRRKRRWTGRRSFALTAAAPRRAVRAGASLLLPLGDDGVRGQRSARRAGARGARASSRKHAPREG
mmetsp:Transcript_12743/g.53420  ORF Transcript_12743/g.53420 Transcript_12743/m.53420 type:complete len:203 (-) Transcript_12743:1010-1618(-)